MVFEPLIVYTQPQIAVWLPKTEDESFGKGYRRVDEAIGQVGLNIRLLEFSTRLIPGSKLAYRITTSFLVA